MNEFQLAAKNGDFEFIKQLKYKDIKDLINIIVENGHFEILKWIMVNHNIKNTKAIMDTAAEYGHFDIVCWLQKNTFTGCKNAVKCAINNDHVNVVKFLYEHYPDKFKKQSTTYIKSIEMLKFINTETNIELNYKYIIYNFIKNNNLDDIKFLHNLNLLRFDQYIIELIFTKCNMDIIDFIYTNYKTKNIKRYINLKLFHACLYNNRNDSMIYIFNKLKKRFNSEIISVFMHYYKEHEFMVFLKNNIDKEQWGQSVELFSKKYCGKCRFVCGSC